MKLGINIMPILSSLFSMNASVARLEVFTGMKIHIMVLWVVHLLYSEHGGSMVL
jgi:hypothetical protein